MLLELAVADAYGASFEFAIKEFVEEFNTLEGYIKHPRFKRQMANAYTDDSQQSIAIAELLIQYDVWTPEIIANKLVEVFKRDPRAGYSRGSLAMLKQASNGREFIGLIRGDSDRCGGAMRAMPIGILPNMWDVIKKSVDQACVTHNSEGGIISATASALMAHYFIYDNGSKNKLPKFLNRWCPGPWDKFWEGDIVSTDGIECVWAAYTMIMKYDNMADILKEAVNLCGDTDSVSCISLAIASNSKEIEQNLPQILIDDLENDDYGRDYLIRLDNRLFKLKDK